MKSASNNFAPETGSATVGAPTATVAGGVYASKPITNQWTPAAYSGAITLVTSTHGANTIRTVRYTSPHRQNEIGTKSTICFVVTTPAVAGSFAKIAVYEEGASGYPEGLIWYSGDVLIDAATVVSSTFAAGTWVRTTYQNGNNLRITPANRIWLSVQVSASVTLRALSSPFPIGLAPTTFSTTATAACGTLTVTPAPAFGIPADPWPIGSVDYVIASTSAPLIALLEA